MMNPQERDVISGIFDRLKQAEHMPRDAEAEAFIAERVASQPYAPYVMAQAIHVQEQALANLSERVKELEAELEAAKKAPQSTSFLGGLFGGGSSEPPRTSQSAWSSPSGPATRPLPEGVPPPPQAGGPWGGGPQGGGPAGGPWGGGPSAAPWGGQQRQGGGFLSTALTTAAGVAGGMVVGNVLANAFGLGSHGQQQPNITENIFEAPQTAVFDEGAGGKEGRFGDDARFDQASYDDNADDGSDDGSDDGGDGGGGDDGGNWA